MAKQNTLAITVKAFFSERYFLRRGEADDSNFFIASKDNCCSYLTAFFLKNCCNKFLRLLRQDFYVDRCCSLHKNFWACQLPEKKNNAAKTKRKNISDSYDKFKEFEGKYRNEVGRSHKWYYHKGSGKKKRSLLICGKFLTQSPGAGQEKPRRVQEFPWPASSIEWSKRPETGWCNRTGGFAVVW